MPSLDAAFWWCPAIGVPPSRRVLPGDTQTWRRADFDDRAVSNSGISLWRLGGLWTVSNHSTSMTNVFVMDPRSGRRHVPPEGALALGSRWSWLLVPSMRGLDRPHVVRLRLGDDPPLRRDTDRSPDSRTLTPDEPIGGDARSGLLDARAALDNADTRALLVAYVRPYFTVTSRFPERATHEEVARCIPGSTSRGENALRRMRTLLAGEAGRMSAEAMLRALIRHGLITMRDVQQQQQHNANCGHRPEDVDPDAWP